RIKQGRRHLRSARRISLTQGQKFEQEIDNRLRISRNMAAVGHQLARELTCEKLCCRALRTLIGIAADAEFGERDRREKAPFALRVFGERAHEMRARAGEMMHEAAIKFRLRIL